MHLAECGRGEEDPLYSGIDVFWDPRLKTTVVVAKKPLKAKELMLPPCVPNAVKLRTESTHPSRVVIEACNSKGGPPTTFYIHPEWVHPEEDLVATASAVAGAAPAVAGGAPVEHRVWKWSGKEVMHPIWAVRRLSADELRTKTKATRFNMEQHWKAITASVVNGDSTQCWVVRVPFLTNSCDLATGVELLWEALPKQKQAVISSANWVSDQLAKEKAKAANEAKEKKRKAVELKSDQEI